MVKYPYEEPPGTAEDPSAGGALCGVKEILCIGY